MTTAEDLVKVRRNGLVYLQPHMLDAGRSVASKVGVDFDDWLNRYFDYDFYT